MKQYIFLVEDIIDNRPITLTEKIYSPVLSRNRQELIGIPNFDETPTLLNSDLYKTIKFVRVEDFVREVGIGEISSDYEVYYFISTVHALQTFHFMNLLGIEVEVINFLKKHKIPVIIDSSMEITHPLDFLSIGTFTKILDKGIDITESDKFFRGMEKLEFIVVHPMYRPLAEKTNYGLPFKNIKNVMFPTPFFYLRPKLLDQIVNNRDSLFESIKNKKITDNTVQWVAYSYTERLNRMLFFMRVHLENLVDNKGKYSLLMPLRNGFIRYYKEIFAEVPWVTEELLTVLDDIRVIDELHSPIRKPKEEIIPRTQVEDIWYNIVLETLDHRLEEREDLSTHTMLTEKTAKPIIEGLPFITFGGKDLTKLLKHYGFELYEDLNFQADGNLYRELDQVIDKVKYLDNLSLTEKNKLNDNWKETMMYNYDHYAKLNAGQLYIDSLKGVYRPIFE